LHDAAAGDAVLGIFAMCLVNLGFFVHAICPLERLEHATSVVTTMMVEGLVGTVASVVLSVCVVGVASVRHIVCRNDFGADGSYAIEDTIKLVYYDVSGKHG